MKLHYVCKWYDITLAEWLCQWNYAILVQLHYTSGIMLHRGNFIMLH